MVVSKLITGTLVESFLICKRQCWLMSHQITPDQDHPYLELGRFIDMESYSDERKKINLENMVIDLIKTENNTLLIGEIKKTSKAQESAKLQLLFYLYNLKYSYGIEAKGILLFPKEKKRVRVDLSEDEERKIERIIYEIKDIIYQELPPPPEKVNYCVHCAYREFCWS